MSFLFSQPAPGVLPANSVDFSEVETIASNTLLGNNTGSDSVILELSKTQATAMLDVMGAASAGSGGLKGLVPASSAGDQAKFLRGDASWATVDLSNLANRNLSNLSAPTALNAALLAGNGTVSAPSYSFTNSTNSGLWFDQANNVLRISYNGTTQLSIGVNTITARDIFSCATFGATTGSINSFSAGSITLSNTNAYGIVMYADTVNTITYPRSIGRGFAAALLRMPSVDVWHAIRIGKSIDSKKTYGGTLMVRQPDPLNMSSGATTTANAATTFSVTVPTGGFSPYNFINIGDYIQLNGLSTVAKVLDWNTTTGDITVDTPLGDGVSRAIIQLQDIVSFRKNDATEVFLIDRNGIIKTNSGEKHKSLHAQAGTLDVITATTSDYYIGVDTSSAAKTVNLPAAATAGQGFVLVIKDESGNAATRNITIDANASELIDGALTQVINTNYGSVSLMCNGSAWFIM